MNRKDAAIELNAIYNSYELRKNSLTSTYRKIFRDSQTENWHLIGFAHDYAV
jgi:hypothetical protein